MRALDLHLPTAHVRHVRMSHSYKLLVYRRSNSYKRSYSYISTTSKVCLYNANHGIRECTKFEFTNMRVCVGVVCIWLFPWLQLS